MKRLFLRKNDESWMSLPGRLRVAADTLEELSALYGHKKPAEVQWFAMELREEADKLDWKEVTP
jgi:hypothetical protein